MVKDKVKIEKQEHFNLEDRPKKIVVIDENIKPVDNEEDYWKYHKIYSRKLKKLSLNIKKLLYYPDEYIDEFEIILCEMVGYGVVSLEWADEKRKETYKLLSNPRELEVWVEKSPKLKKIYDKLVKRHKKREDKETSSNKP